MDAITTFNTLGLELPSPWAIAAALVFGLFGWAAFRRGRKRQDAALTWGGVVLMLYPYAVSQTWLLWAIGLALSGWLLSRWR